MAQLLGPQAQVRPWHAVQDQRGCSIRTEVANHAVDQAASLDLKLQSASVVRDPCCTMSQHKRTSNLCRGAVEMPGGLLTASKYSSSYST